MPDAYQHTPVPTGVCIYAKDLATALEVGLDELRGEESE